MKTPRRAVLALVLCSLLAACAGIDKVALKPEAKQGLRRIALVEVAEPAPYTMDPGQLPGGAALYMFGALGGAILGGIESSRFQSATNRLTGALQPLDPALGKLLMTKIEEGLQAKGYEVMRVPAPPRLPDGKLYDLAKVQGEPDAVIVATLAAGYSAAHGGVAPRVALTATLHRRQGQEALFSDGYLYGNKSLGNLVFIASDSRHSFPNVDALYAEIEKPLDGLREGTARVAERFVADL